MSFRISVLLTAVLISFYFPLLFAKGWSNLAFLNLIAVIDEPSPTTPFALVNFDLSQGENTLISQSQSYFERSELMSETSSAAYGYGIISTIKGNTSEANRRFSQAGQERVWLGQVFLGLMKEQESEGDSILAVLQSSPLLVAGLRGEARVLLKQGKVHDAIMIFTRIVQLIPNSEQAWLDLGEGFANNADWNQARDAYAQASKLVPNDLNVKIRVIQTNYRLTNDLSGTKEAIIEILPKLKTIKTLDDELRLYNAYWFLGQLSQDEKEYHEAIDWYQQAKALPRVADWWSMSAISLSYQALGDSEEATKWMQNAVTEAPNDSGVYSSLGDLLISQEQLEEAEQSYRKAISLSPKSTSPRNRLARVLAKMGRYKEAAEEYRKVLELDPHNRQAKDGLLDIDTQP